jgi:hypothetical protein
MKRFINVFGSILLGVILSNCIPNNYNKQINADSSAVNTVKHDSIIDNRFVEYEVLPSYPGGDAAYLKFLNLNLNKVIVCDTNLIAGLVVISCEIDTNGQIGNIKVLKSYNQMIDNEFLRVIRLMPKWNPGEQYINGDKGPWIKVSNKMNLPLKIPYKNRLY